MSDTNEILIYDDLFDEKFLLELNEICDDLPNKPNNISNRRTYPYGTKGSHNILGCVLFSKLSKYVYQSICPLSLMWAFDNFANKYLNKDLELFYIQSNLQTCGMDGSYHVDGEPGTKTAILFATHGWKKEWGGEFQIIGSENEIVQTIEYVPGRIIYFDSSIPHRGLSPMVPNIFRHSISFRLRSM
jgi:hypothetical protein